MHAWRMHLRAQPAGGQRRRAGMAEAEPQQPRVAAVRLQNWCTTWGQVLGGVVGVALAIYFGLGVTVITNAVSLWLLRMATLLILRYRLAEWAAYMWLSFLAIGGVGLVFTLGQLWSDTAAASITPWIFLFGCACSAHRPIIRKRVPWSAGRRAAWCLAMLSFCGCGAYGCTMAAIGCPSSSDGPPSDHPTLRWAARLRGEFCRCAGSYAGELGGSERFVWAGEAEACACFGSHSLFGGGSATSCIRVCNGTVIPDIPLTNAGSCQCTPRADAGSYDNDPRCTMFADVEGNAPGADICRGPATVMVGDSLCQHAAWAALLAAILLVVLIGLTLLEVRFLTEMPALSGSVAGISVGAAAVARGPAAAAVRAGTQPEGTGTPLLPSQT